MNSMKNLTALLSLFTLIFISKIAYGQDTVLKVGNPAFKVNINHVSKKTFKIAGVDSVLYDVQIKFQAPGKTSIFIDGYGTVKPNEDISFYAYSRTIKVNYNNHLSTVLLPLYKSAMDGSGIDIPGFKDFPLEKREETYSNQEAFENRLRDVLQKYCIKGIIPPGDSGGNYWITPYFNFYAQGSTQGQISFWISKPEKNQAGQKYHISYVAREDKTHDPDWRPAGKNVTAAADQFFLQVINQTNSK